MITVFSKIMWGEVKMELLRSREIAVLLQLLTYYNWSHFGGHQSMWKESFTRETILLSPSLIQVTDASSTVLRPYSESLSRIEWHKSIYCFSLCWWSGHGRIKKMTENHSYRPWCVCVCVYVCVYRQEHVYKNKSTLEITVASPLAGSILFCNFEF